MSFDISSVGVKDVGTCELEDPNGQPLRNPDGDVCSITVYGPGSKQYKKAEAAKTRAAVDIVRKGGRKMKDGDSEAIDAEFLAAITVSFNHFGYKDYTPGFEMFRAAYLDRSIGYINVQVLRFADDWANFTPDSKPNLSDTSGNLPG